MRRRILLAVEAEQSRYVDDSLVHLPPLSLPRHLLQQILKEGAGATQPAGQQIHPSAATEGLAGDHAAQRPESEVVGCV